MVVGHSLATCKRNHVTRKFDAFSLTKNKKDNISKATTKKHVYQEKLTSTFEVNIKSPPPYNNQAADQPFTQALLRFNHSLVIYDNPTTIFKSENRHLWIV